MREQSESVLVRLPAGDIWDFLADYDNVLRLGWEEGYATRMRPSRRCTERYRAMAVWQGLKTHYIACLEAAERPRLLVWSTREGLAKSWARFVLEPLAEDSTRVEVTLHFEMAAVRSAEPLAWDLLLPSFDRTISHLEHLHQWLASPVG